MAEGRIACRLAARNFCKWAGNPRFAFVLGFLAVTVVSSVLPIRAFLRDTGVPMAPWLFPFWCTDLYKQATMLLCAAFLLCDAPFLDESAPYVIVRAGRGVWAAGQLLYILLAAAVFVLYLAALTVLPFLDRLEWTQSWGKAIGTLALTDAAGAYGLSITFYRSVLYGFTPPAAMGLSLLFNWMMVSLLGLVMFVLNLCVGRSAGAIACCGLVMFNYFINNFLNPRLYRYFPASLSNIAYFNGSDFTPQYAAGVLAGMLALLLAAALLSVRGKNLSARRSI